VHQISGVLLTGGESRRMGVDKARIVVNGETLAARAARVLRSVCDPVIEVGSGVSGLPAVREEPAGGGPLVALLAGVGALGEPRAVLLLACDLPFVESPLLRLLADWPGSGTVIPMVDGRAQYACARYGEPVFAAARDALIRGERSLRAVAEAGAEFATEADWSDVASALAFADADTPQDLHRLGLSLPENAGTEPHGRNS
jgi:molybdopterin-guanine dinucleotide biosynthesis protein A